MRLTISLSSFIIRRSTSTFYAVMLDGSTHDITVNRELIDNSGCYE